MLPSDPRASGALLQMDPDFGGLAVEVGAFTWSQEGLPPRLCSLLCVAADLSVGTVGMPLQMHVQMALQNGVTPQELHEVVLTVAPWAGYPQSLVALARLHEILQAGPAGPAPEPPAAPAPLAPELEAILADFDAGDPALAAFVAKQTRRLWSRPGLACSERALLVLATHACRGDLGDTFRLHVRLARAAGVSDVPIRSALRFIGEYGFSRAAAALREL